jgi:DNA-binding NarL/FixJ family response regulator
MGRSQPKTSVLILDPHTVMREGLKSMIGSHADWKVSVATGSTAEFRIRVAEQEPDLVIMDPELKDADGLSLSREIHRKYPDLPILLVGPEASYEKIVAAFRAGVRGYAVKDSSLPELLSGTRQVLEGAYFLDKYATRAVVLRLIDRKEPAAPAEVEDERYTALTAREKEILCLLAEGYPNPAIAERLGISAKTVSNHRGKLMKKLRFRSYPDMLRYACRIGIVREEPRTKT